MILLLLLIHEILCLPLIQSHGDISTQFLRRVFVLPAIYSLCSNIWMTSKHALYSVGDTSKFCAIMQRRYHSSTNLFAIDEKRFN
ncbi:hypothetical protein DAI22_06g124600 [Oryza sativa Japonica Group]|nr:hypothetical protein DAI22_06g124600 [Oryza sativa Japonica Group]